jgi:hypothetical protein
MFYKQYMFYVDCSMFHVVHSTFTFGRALVSPFWTTSLFNLTGIIEYALGDVCKKLLLECLKIHDSCKYQYARFAQTTKPCRYTQNNYVHDLQLKQQPWILCLRFSWNCKENKK